MSFTSGKFVQQADGSWAQVPKDADKTTAAIAIFERFSLGESIPHEQMQAAVRHIVRLHKSVGGAG